MVGAARFREETRAKNPTEVLDYEKLRELMADKKVVEEYRKLRWLLEYVRRSETALKDFAELTNINPRQGKRRVGR